MDNLKSKAQVSYDTHNEEVIVRRKRRKIMGPFSAIGKLSDTQSDREDIFDLLGQVSKNAFLLFNQFKKKFKGTASTGYCKGGCQANDW
jgi:hypothetical protein